MDMWEAFERAAVAALEQEVAKQPIDRDAMAHALHLFAIGKNRDPHIHLPPLDILTDVQLTEMVRALLEGNRVGA
jgi:hypothetical protein